MTNLKQQLIRHEMYMQRLLSEILDDKYLAVNLYFKGGTCARMLGFLDRFSVNLDFDLSPKADKKRCKKILLKIFNDLGLEIKDQSSKSLQFFLKYPAPTKERNILKIEILDKSFKNNDYAPQYIPSIDRTANCQTIETMFANKLVALTDRFKKGQSIAGRDVYDIHYFFTKGFDYKKEIIEERTKKDYKEYLRELKDFINEKVTIEVIEQDLGLLVPPQELKNIKKYIKQETINFLDAEIS